MDTPENQNQATTPVRTAVDESTQRQQTMDDKEFYSRIIQNAAAPLYAIDSKHSVIFWNNALAKLTGKSSFQMKGTKQQWSAFYPAKRPTLADLVIDKNVESINETYSEVEPSQLTHGAYRAEGWYDTIGGKRRYLLFEAAPIVNNQNEIVAAVETVKDITDRKQAQEAVDNQNQFLNEILDAIPNPVFYKNTSHAFIGCNKAFSIFFGTTMPEVAGKTLADIISPELAQASIVIDQEIITSRSPMTYETPMSRCDGQLRTVLVTKAPFSGADGTLAGIVGTFVDVTEQRLLDEQITRAKREWEETLDSLKDFVILTDADHRVRRCNRLLCDKTGKAFAQ
ncbi:MAG: PAS domain S-box protein, partial [Verrucomicrobia bacterium]|nr:PAS domain S-box protein [Deltaproteobacteria bacterium]